jgi:hypothetical protein
MISRISQAVDDNQMTDAGAGSNIFSSQREDYIHIVLAAEDLNSDSHMPFDNHSSNAVTLSAENM